MTSVKPRVKGQFPNKLNKIRKAARIRQTQLVELCEGLAKKDPDKFTSVSRTTISVLENGYHKPKPKTAITLAAVLGHDIDKLFPLGVEDMIHNPEGVSGSDPSKKGGRPRA